MGKMGRIETGPLVQTNIRNQKHERRTLIFIHIIWSTTLNFKKKDKPVINTPSEENREDEE